MVQIPEVSKGASIGIGALISLLMGAEPLSRMVDQDPSNNPLPDDFVTPLLAGLATGTGAYYGSRAIQPNPYAKVGPQAKVLLEEVRKFDPTTASHMERVSEYAKNIAQSSGLNKAQTEQVKLGGLLHDYGKITVPPEIINKAGKLTDVERATVNTHAAAGANLLTRKGIPQDITKLVGQHHEYYAGGGYPAGTSETTKGRDAFSSILTLADSYDAMNAARSYKAGMPQAVALDRIKQAVGTQFDPIDVNLVTAKPNLLSPSSSPLADLATKVRQALTGVIR
jgi:putative nucleotidyltransferase with HDIG domain